MTKKSDNSSQERKWENRLAFLDGIIAPNEEESLVAVDSTNDSELVPPVRPPNRRARRPPFKKQRRPRVTSPQPVPPKESPSAKARNRVKERVDELREDAVRKAMPGIALALYREARERITDIDSESPESEIHTAGWYMQAAIEAFKAANRYKDAASALIFLVEWLLKIKINSNANLQELLEEAKSYLDHKVDADLKPLNDCHRLERIILDRTSK